MGLSYGDVSLSSPIDVLCANFVKYGWREIGEIVRYLPDKKNKISPGSPAIATARISPKICHGQPPTTYSECLEYHPNRFNFGAVIAERMNTAKTRRKVNPLFGWSLASSRIINAALLFQMMPCFRVINDVIWISSLLYRQHSKILHTQLSDCPTLVLLSRIQECPCMLRWPFLGPYVHCDAIHFFSQTPYVRCVHCVNASILIERDRMDNRRK